jgi:crotonobetainyl-CoA:carnitine CoA-transferase CaiB-like acyl-CoA transferase
MAGILEGLKVVDMGHVVAVPSAGAILADWGAEVIKVEPVTGELARMGRTPNRVLQYDGGEVDWVIEYLNRNKKGLALNLKKDAGKKVLYKLIEKTDIFMSNYESSALKKLELDYTTLSRFNPRLIYATLTAYGTAGPDKDQRGFDYSAGWARTGGQYMMGEPGSTPPLQRPGMMDRVTGVHIVAGVLAAIIHRERTGKGQQLEFSLYHSGVWTIAEDIQGALVERPLLKHNRKLALNPMWNSYRAKDEHWFQLTMHQPDIQWPDFCRAIERPEWENDSRFSNAAARTQNSEELIRMLDDIFASKMMEDWERRFRENNCIYSRIQSPTEVVADPQAIANNFFTEMDHPIAGKMKLVTTPVTFKQNPASIKIPAPRVGQHNEEILLGLGYSREDIARLKDEGVIP